MSGPGRPSAWSGERAERHLRSLELFGMRFGLDRMRRMMTALRSPERRFDSIHVLGTNGKTSTTRMTAAILQRHGLRTGSYTSPHLVSYTERVQVAERDLSMGAFAAAVARAAWAAERVNRTLAADDHVTQFELLTAAAFWELAERGVEVAVIEAGLGGRYDATSVIDPRVTVLTNVGLEHTRWLGPTVADIAAEKLAVVRPAGTLALGADLHPDALAVAREVAREREARILQVGASGHEGAVRETLGRDGPPAPQATPEWDTAEPLLARGDFQRRNFALARLAAGAHLAATGIEESPEAVAQAARSTAVSGRMEILPGEPLTVLDGAHNPDAALALARSLPGVLGGRPLGLVLGVLEDKDAAGILGTLLPLCERAWFTAPPGARALPPPALLSLARQQGFEEALCEPDPVLALRAARAWASDRDGAVLATGSVYLVGELLGSVEGLDLAREGVRP
ncbi:MAG TPA: Mur ligase family protein [Solirubrobacteraceae bacterium]|nr:Mur ligase family protein [Solirubrobacteraceae bacterium]